MVSSPRISVVVPTYHAEKYLGECLDSLIGQTLRPYEIIVCDDGSTDRTPELIERYADAHPDLIRPVLHPSNQGISRNLNSGFQRVKGDWVSLCAGDDWWAANKLEREMESLAADPMVRWTYSDSISYHQRTKEIERFKRVYDGVSGQILYHVLTRQLSLRNWMAHISLIREVGLFDEALKCFEDWDYKIRLAMRSPIVHCSNPGVYYRRHRHGISRRLRQNAVWLEKIHVKHEHLLKEFTEPQASELKRIWKRDLANHKRRWKLIPYARWIARRLMLKSFR